MSQCVIRKQVFVSLQLLIAIFGVASDQLSSPYEANIPTEDLRDGLFFPVHKYQQPKAGILKSEVVVEELDNQRSRSAFNGTLPSLSKPTEENPVGQTKKVKEVPNYEKITSGIAYRFNPISSKRFGIPSGENGKERRDINEKSNYDNINHHRTKKEATDGDQLTPETSQSTTDHIKQPLLFSSQSENKPILSLNEKQDVFNLGVIDQHGQSAPRLVTSPFKEAPPVEIHGRIPQNRVQGFSAPVKFQNADPPVTSPEGFPQYKFQNTNLPVISTEDFPSNRFQNTNPPVIRSRDFPSNKFQNTNPSVIPPEGFPPNKFLSTDQPVISPEGFPPNKFQNTDPSVIPLGVPQNKYQNTDPSVLSPEGFPPNKFQNTDPSVISPEGFPPNKFQNTDQPVISPEGFPPNKFQNTDQPVISPEGFPPNKFQNTDQSVISPEGFPPNKFQTNDQPVISQKGFPPNKFQNTDPSVIPPEEVPPNKFQNTNPPIVSPESYQPIKFQNSNPPAITQDSFPPNKFQNSFPINRPEDYIPLSLPPDDNDNLPTTKLKQVIPVSQSARENTFLKESTQTIINDHITSSISSHDNPGDLSIHPSPVPIKQVNSFLQKDPETNIFEPPVYIPTEGAKPDLGFPKQLEPGPHKLTNPLQIETKVHDHSGTGEHSSVSSFSDVPGGVAESNSGDLKDMHNSDIFLPSTETHAPGQFPVAHIPKENEKIQESDHPQITQISSPLPNLTPSKEPNYEISPDSEISSSPGQVDISPQVGISFPPSGGIHTDPFLSSTTFQALSPHFQPVQAPRPNPLVTPFNPYTTLFMPQFGNVGSGGSPFNIFPQTPFFNYPLSGGNFFN